MTMQKKTAPKGGFCNRLTLNSRCGYSVCIGIQRRVYTKNLPCKQKTEMLSLKTHILMSSRYPRLSGTGIAKVLFLVSVREQTDKGFYLLEILIDRQNQVVGVTGNRIGRGLNALTDQTLTDGGWLEPQLHENNGAGGNVLLKAVNKR